MGREKKGTREGSAVAGDSVPPSPRRLVEDYWRAVLDAGREPPAYRTFSDRYRGVNGAAYATRREGRLREMTVTSSSAVDSVQWCMERADAEELAGQFQEAQNYLQAALEHVRQRETRSTGNIPKSTVLSEVRLEGDRILTASLLFRLGKLSMRKGDHREALSILTLGSRIDPLTPATYALRGACYEYLEEYDTACEEYKKYLSLSEPTMAVLAHTGQSALKAGQYDVAEQYLNDLLRLTKVNTSSVNPNPGNNSRFFDSPSFYESHAYYSLGLVRDAQAAQVSTNVTGNSISSLKVEELAQQAQNFFDLAASNSSYVIAYEDAVESAIAAQDAPLALENLRHLQRLHRNCPKYYSRAADVCAMTNDTKLEVEELSRALDQRQSVLSRRQTLLHRAAVYALKLNNLDNAIVDLTLLLSLPGKDHYTAMAYLQRARAFQQRSCERPQTGREDVAAALSDYDKFVETALMHPEELQAPPESITEAMLILANGAFKEKDYSRAAHFFARAIARGWQPKEPLPQRIHRLKKIEDATSTTNAATAAPVMTSLPSSSTTPLAESNLLAEMYVAIAHTVIEKFPVSEDMFRVSYEQREKPSVSTLPESKKSKAAERKEAEKPIVAVPAVGYQVVEEHYQRLRALEPTVFSSLEYELLELWEPYRTEVERLREDLMLIRSGKKVKRR
ncbi:Tetratricopeptide repeat [Trypanosoma melophagium]|uniref:Tetratricopeptide repeat n=1 Tax=Trypanosoma melophagium TaxID=715481 RepID=UPI003519F14C|nr:Tetratricopeptide repeat [Trypanosoma melophagium]